MKPFNPASMAWSSGLPAAGLSAIPGALGGAAYGAATGEKGNRLKRSLLYALGGGAATAAIGGGLAAYSGYTGSQEARNQLIGDVFARQRGELGSNGPSDAYLASIYPDLKNQESFNALGADDQKKFDLWKKPALAGWPLIPDKLTGADKWRERLADPVAKGQQHYVGGVLDALEVDRGEWNKSEGLPEKNRAALDAELFGTDETKDGFRTIEKGELNKPRVSSPVLKAILESVKGT